MCTVFARTCFQFLFANAKTFSCEKDERREREVEASGADRANNDILCDCICELEQDGTVYINEQAKCEMCNSKYQNEYII